MTIEERIAAADRAMRQHFGCGLLDMPEMFERVIALAVGFQPNNIRDGINDRGELLEVKLCRSVQSNQGKRRSYDYFHFAHCDDEAQNAPADVFVLCGYDNGNWQFFVFPGFRLAGKGTVAIRTIDSGRSYPKGRFKRAHKVDSHRLKEAVRDALIQQRQHVPYPLLEAIESQAA